jgi:hypothetical protein
MTGLLLDYEGTLAALVELMGRPVSVEVRISEPDPVDLAGLLGRLERGSDIARPEEGQELLGFRVGESGAFYVERPHFRGAWREDRTLLIQSGPGALIVKDVSEA